MSNKGREIEPTKFLAEAKLDQPSAKPFVVSKALDEYFVIYGGTPLDVYQRAELASLQDDRLRALYQAIENLLTPYNQAVHTTAFLQSQYFQEQEALQSQPKPRPTGIGARLARLVGSSLTDRTAPKTVERAGGWENKVGNNYYTHTLKFHEDLAADPRDIALDRYRAEISDSRGGGPFARVSFAYSPERRLREITVSRVNCPTEKFGDLIQDKKVREEVALLTHPRGNMPWPKIEWPGRSSADFVFNIEDIPAMAISQRGGGGGIGILSIDSRFIYDSATDMFLRNWDSSNLDQAKRHQLSTRGELSAQEYLALLKGLLVVPLQNIKSLTR